MSNGVLRPVDRVCPDPGGRRPILSDRPRRLFLAIVLLVSAACVGPDKHPRRLPEPLPSQTSRTTPCKWSVLEMKSGTLLWFPGNSAYAVSDGVGRVIVLDGGVEITMRVYDRDVKRWITCAVER